MTRILTIVGSLRAGSTNLQLAHTAQELGAQQDLTIELYQGIAELPFYNEDVDTPETVPAEAEAFREAITVADAVLVFTPEYNGTMPAVLKNAVDWASRPFGASALLGKPLVVAGSAFGQYGGVWAQDEARKAFGIAGASVLADPSVAIPGSLQRFAENHPRNDDEVTEQLRSLLVALKIAVENKEQVQEATAAV
ncbi:NADPH-dependent FMN reductase [Nakamurella leprariae]|uniref:NAD(P)H-dependent oxidoreductase n=1 Tax=Nakamurella leprariae TaxID=2803911 RepID=A0A938YEV7_9ACTN|nr:NAD(P)H-dependent oxidoreductase [Nakamurella leprariae]MBM9466488.1 NAD(P)H-dependent oxidoreductase [Nakamurella leprariae]